MCDMSTLTTYWQLSTRVHVTQCMHVRICTMFTCKWIASAHTYREQIVRSASRKSTWAQREEREKNVNVTRAWVTCEERGPWIKREGIVKFVNRPGVLIFLLVKCRVLYSTNSREKSIRPRSQATIRIIWIFQLEGKLKKGFFKNSTKILEIIFAVYLLGESD